jgi:predicted ArsR family transcriptional regulator
MARRDHPQALSERSRSRSHVLDLLRRSAAGLRIEELAEQSGLHVNTLRFHLSRLVAEGLVHRRAEPRTGPGRPRLTYVAPARPDLGRDKRDYRLLAGLLTEMLVDAVPDAPARAAALGRAWGASLMAEAPEPAGDPMGRLVEVLADTGFAPEVNAEEIRLRHCPFLEVAEQHPAIVCSLHRGLMDGVLTALDAPLRTERLVPFAEPAACVARLRPADPGDRAA